MRHSIERILIAILSLWMGVATLHAANVVTLSGAGGSPGEKASVTVTMDTDADDIVAAEIRILLPEEVEPVAESLKLDSRRAPDHSVTADMNGREFVIVLFNTSLKPIPAGKGELLSFKLDLGENPGHFHLTPKVKLSGKDGQRITASASGSTLDILAPRMELPVTVIDFGRIPIHSEEVRQVELRNTGTTDLTATEYTTDVEGLTAEMPGTVKPGESVWMTLRYRPTVRSKGIDGRLHPTADGVGRSQFVRILSEPFSVNEIHLGNATGVCDEEVAISVKMNNMEPIIGADITIPLPEELDFVEGSLRKGERAEELNVESYVDSTRKLRIVLFGTDNKPVRDNYGELMEFRLKLNGRSGSYWMTPAKTVLANASGENMVSAVYSGEVRVSAPYISAPSSWSVGNVSLSSSETFSITVSSYGEAPLSIESVVFRDGIGECIDELPLTIEPYQSKEINVRFTNPVFGPFTSLLNIYSNDPDNRMSTVEVTGNFYSPNEMEFEGRTENSEFFIDAYLTNEGQITAMQMDLVCPEGMMTDESLLQISDRAVDHSSTMVKVAADRYRIVIYSLSNTPFIGNEGRIFSLEFLGDDMAEKQVRFENIKLSSTEGLNMTTPDTDVKVGELPASVGTVFENGAEVEIYSINGVRIKCLDNPEGLKLLPPGIYIFRSASRSIKTLIR